MDEDLYFIACLKNQNLQVIGSTAFFNLKNGSREFTYNIHLHAFISNLGMPLDSFHKMPLVIGAHTSTTACIHPPRTYDRFH